MEASGEILGCIKNIRYYAGEINKLCQKQIELDFRNYEMSEPDGTTRLTVLGIISGDLAQVENWLTNIEMNLGNVDMLEPPRKELLQESLL